MQRAHGMFISQHQKTFKWFGQTHYLGYRVTDGLVPDTKYTEFLPEIRKAPRKIAVHNFRNHKTAVQQVDSFLNCYQGEADCIGGDYEDTDTPMSQYSAEEFSKFLEIIAKETQLPVIMYAGVYALRDNLYHFVPGLKEVPLWAVRLNNNANDYSQPNLSIDGVPVATDWKFWQYTWVGNGEDFGVGSENVCLDMFNGTVEDLNDFLKKEPVDELAALRMRVKVLEALYQEVNTDLEELATKQYGINKRLTASLEETRNKLSASIESQNYVNEQIWDAIAQNTKYRHKHWWQERH